MLDFLKFRRSSLLGLTLEGRRLEGVVLRRVAGALQIERSFEASLSLDPLTNDPELVGREIRNRLDEAGVRESRCAVGIPLNWALSLQTKMPEIPEADVGSFLNLQAERGFPYGPEDLSVSISRFRSSKGEQYATLMAIPKNHLILLERVLVAARLKPVSFSLAIAALQPARSGDGILAVMVGENCVDLQVTCAGGVVALRALQGAIETDGAKRRIDVDLLTRELRLTLGQLPNEVRETITKMRVFGRAEWVRPVLDEIAAGAKAMGLQVEARSVPQADGIGPVIPVQENSPVALAMAARCLGGNTTGFEFLPPKISAWAQATSRFSSRKILWSGASAGALTLLVSGAFLVQYWKLSTLESKWRAMEPKVKAVEDMQQNIRKFRPWFADSIRSLTILRKLTEVFPEDGAVSVRTLEIKDLSTISCSGVAQDNQAWLRVLDRLREASHIQDIKVERVQGKAPLQFTFDFHWTEEGKREN
ncbi:MAG: hypothetical protein ACYDH9_08760 [Limisphaerales bacterium]